MVHVYSKSTAWFVWFCLVCVLVIYFFTNLESLAVNMVNKLIPPCSLGLGKSETEHIMFTSPLDLRNKAKIEILNSTIDIITHTAKQFICYQPCQEPRYRSTLK